MSKISRSFEEIDDHYEIIVIGSGYGAGISASRMARAGRRVCVMERGREIRPGDYPDTLGESIEDTQVDLGGCASGSRTALLDLRVNDDQNVLVGCGLGGTSLINANVSLRAEPRVFDDDRWPEAFRADLDGRLEEGYRRAEEMLKPNTYPDNMPRLDKMEALKTSAELIGQPWKPTPINVTFEDKINHVGVEQKQCTLCGDCISGCNYGAKNTTLMNYLPDAANHGAELFTQVEVRHIAKRDDGKWVVHYHALHTGAEKFDAPTMFVTADIVILGAGTLGSTEILLRSAENGLSLSGHLGDHFSGNGDVLGFGYNGEKPINGIGMGHKSPEQMKPVGPCITSVIDHREQPVLNDGMVVEEGSIPGALHSILPEMFAVADDIGGSWAPGESVEQKLGERWRKNISTLEGAYRGAISRTQTYLVMAHDGTEGKCHLEKDRIRIDWPGVGREPIFDKIQEELVDVNKHLGGRFVKDPIWNKMLNDRLISVHPLGGCRMGESGDSGVVNHRGQVFAGSDETIHDGLYVTDGSVMPRSLGVNPLLTISAVSERAMALLAEERGWTIDYTLPSAPRQPAKELKPGIEFTECMKGFYAPGDHEYQEAYDLGKRSESPFRFVLTVRSEDAETMLSEPTHQARIVGMVEAPALSGRPLTVTQGTFNLFVPNPDEVATSNMKYNMRLTDENGRQWWFEGHKIMQQDPLIDMWAQTTTLYCTVYDGDSDQAPLAGRGILHIAPVDFMKQMTTIQVPNATSNVERLEWKAKFGKFFAGNLMETYGSIGEPLDYWESEGVTRKKRPLNAPVPETHFITTDDQVRLQLTRYNAGGKGPIILAPGLGITSLMFKVDTNDVNLVEYLCAAGYDVWLFDWRGSPVNISSRGQFSLDDAATYDFQAAIPFVQEATGADEVDLLVHCVGSVVFFMAMCRGLKGARSVLSSQSALHLVSPIGNQLKCGLHVPTVLDNLGVEALSAVVNHKVSWKDRLWDKLMEVDAAIEAQGQCDSIVCHRSTFMYGAIFDHANLSQATHDILAEMSGSTNMTVYQQIAACVRAGRAVNAEGEDVYCTNLDALGIPITFLHGANNELWLPKSTAESYELLCRHHNPDLYVRDVVEGYAHADCFFGRDAATDVYPRILKHFERMTGQ